MTLRVLYNKYTSPVKVGEGARGKNLYKNRLNFHTTLNTPITIPTTSTKRLNLTLKKKIRNKP